MGPSQAVSILYVTRAWIQNSSEILLHLPNLFPSLIDCLFKHMIDSGRISA
jgi:hypothetical protein